MGKRGLKTNMRLQIERLINIKQNNGMDINKREKEKL